MEKKQLQELKILSAKIRLNILEMLEKRGYGHLGGSLSIVELMSVLYGKQLKYNAKVPKWTERDMVVLSKGHAGPAWYSALAEVGFFDKKVLFTLNDGDTILPSHPDRLKTPGVDMTTGSLGQGISAAVGVAIGLQRKNSERKVYCIVGDGELNEGQCWEAIQFAAHNRLKNFTLFIDDNKKQLDGTTEEICNPFDFIKKMESFGFETIKVNGASVEEIDKAVSKDTDGRPKCIVLDTIKGQGVEYFENLKANHHIRFTDEMKEILKSEIAKLDIE